MGLLKIAVYACQHQRRWSSCTYPRRQTTDSQRCVDISLTLDNRIINYDLRLECMLVRRGLPVYLVVDWWCQCYQFLYQSLKSINVPSFLRKHLTQACTCITFALLQTNNQISIFNGKFHCCRTDSHDARTMCYVVDAEEHLFINWISFT